MIQKPHILLYRYFGPFGIQPSSRPRDPSLHVRAFDLGLSALLGVVRGPEATDLTGGGGNYGVQDLYPEGPETLLLWN